MGAIHLRGGPMDGRTIEVLDDAYDSVIIPAVWRMGPEGMSPEEFEAWKAAFEEVHGHPVMGYLYVRAPDGVYEVNDPKPGRCRECGIDESCWNEALDEHA